MLRLLLVMHVGGAAAPPEQGGLQTLLKKPIALLDTFTRRRSGHSSNAGMRPSDSNAAGGASQCVEEVAGSLDTQLAAAHRQNGMVPSGSLPVTPGSVHSAGSWGVSTTSKAATVHKFGQNVGF